jgi:signal transduction histidine kinase
MPEEEGRMSRETRRTIARALDAGTEQKAGPDQLREKEYIAAIGTAAAMLAHEVKNPLNGISTTVQLLERSLKKGEPSKEALTATVRDLQNEVDRLQALLGDFESISAPQRLSFAPLDLGELAREITTVAIEECKSRKVEMIAEVRGELPSVEGDRDKLKDALRNLIKSGCEAMPKGGTLTLKAYARDHEVCLEVRDTGDGIPEGLQIFDLFTSTKPGRAGLALVTVQQIILAHGGSITYSSQQGKGTTFRLLLPAIKRAH